MAADNNDGKKIQLNRKMRMWNKYKNIVIGVVSVIVIVAIVAAVLKIGSIGRNDNSGQTATADKNNSNTQDILSLPNTVNPQLIQSAANSFMKNNNVSNTVKPIENPLFM